MRYIGPIAHLRGKLAFVKPPSIKESKHVWAQFDDLWLTRSGMILPGKYRLGEGGFGTLPEPALGLDWHEFDAGDFGPRGKACGAESCGADYAKA